MAGRPLRRLMLTELERRATEAGLDGPLDVVYEWVAAGQTLKDLAFDVSKSVRREISPGTLSLWIHSTDEGRKMIAEARLIAAAMLAEEAMGYIDDADETKEAIAKAKAQADIRMWLAERWNRKDYGADKNNINVNVINTGQLHLDALRQRAIAAPAVEIPEAEFEILEKRESAGISDEEIAAIEASADPPPLLPPQSD